MLSQNIVFYVKDSVVHVGLVLWALKLEQCWVVDRRSGLPASPLLSAHAPSCPRFIASLSRARKRSPAPSSCVRQGACSPSRDLYCVRNYQGNISCPPKVTLARLEKGKAQEADSKGNIRCLASFLSSWLSTLPKSTPTAKMGLWTEHIQTLKY